MTYLKGSSHMNIQFSDRISTVKASAIREILKYTADPKVISFAAGNPAPEAFPTGDVARITSDILQKDPIAALQYSITEGYTPLRETLKDYLRSHNGIGRADDDLIIVSGAQQGLEMTAKILCNEGDTVICEYPSFVGALNAFKSYGANLVGVELEQDGMDLNQLEAALQQNPNTRFIYIIPNFQNPSGITTSLAKRKAIYALAKQYGVFILEDNPYGELRFAGEDVPSIKSFDEDGIVIYCGSFSKILSPGLRVAFVCGPKAITGKLVVAKQAGDVHTNILAQMICHRFMTECDMDAHIARLREIYRHKSGLMLREIDWEFSPRVTHTVPQGGLFLWCTLPEGSDMMAFCNTAVRRNVAVVPGTAFLPSEDDPTTSVRLNYSTPTDEQIVEGIKILGQLTKELF